MRFHTRSLVRSLGCFALLMPFLATAGLDYRITPYNATLAAQWQADLAAMPVYQLPLGYPNTPGAVNLLPHLHLDPSTCNQGDTGTCWLWGCTAVMAIDYDVQHAGTPALTNGLSVQFVASNLEMVNSTLQDGGCPGTFQRFYGLWFELAYNPDSSGTTLPLGGLHAFAFDEAVNAASAQYTNGTPDSPALSLSFNGAQGLLRIAGETGRTYQVQETDALNGDWSIQTTVPMTQPVELVTVPAPAVTNRFWRIKAQ